MNAAIVVLMGTLLGPALALAAGWPDIPFPGGARAESIGEQVRLNGVPVRMHRVLSRKSPNELIRFYQEVLGEQRTEQSVHDSHILSQQRNNFFITVKVRPLSTKLAEVLVLTSDLQAARNPANRPLGFGLPAESVLLFDMESTDAGKRSRQMVFHNRHNLDVNRSSLARELQARGYRLDAIPSRKSPDSEVLYFQGDKREAQLTLVRKDGFTQAVLTTIQTP